MALLTEVLVPAVRNLQFYIKKLRHEISYCKILFQSTDLEQLEQWSTVIECTKKPTTIKLRARRNYLWPNCVHEETNNDQIEYVKKLYMAKFRARRN